MSVRIQAETEDVMETVGRETETGAVLEKLELRVELLKG